MDVLKDIVQVLATTALLWAGRHPAQLRPPATPTQLPDIPIPTVTFYPPSRCLPLPSHPSMTGASAADGQILLQTYVLLFGLSILGFFSLLALGAACLYLRGTQNSPQVYTSPSSEASPTVDDRAIDRVAEARTESEADHRKNVQDLSVKIRTLEGQITVKDAEIKSLEQHHERQLASISRDFESQKSQWAEAQTALEVKGENTAADLRAKIARFEQQIDDHNATVMQITDAHKRELEAARSNHHSALQTIQELSVKIQSFEGQITVKDAEIKSLEQHHKLQLASISNDFESQKSQWAEAQRALEVEGENTAADLRAKIAELEEQVNSHNATVEQITARHQTELEAERSRHHSALETLTTIHEDTTTRLTNNIKEAQALETRLETDLNRALKVNQLLKSSNARLTKVESAQSNTILELKTKLEEASNQLKDVIQEKASVQNRLASAEGEVESIRTRLYDAATEHAAVVRQKDDMITKDSETMKTLRSELSQQQGRATQLASQMQLLKAEIVTKDAENSKLKSSLSSATSIIADLEARNVSASAGDVTQPDVLEDDDARSETDVEGTSPTPTSSPRSLRRRHSANLVTERAKQVVEEVATAAKEDLGGVAGADKAAVEQVRLESTGPDSPGPSQTHNSEPVEPEKGLSASMWATSRTPAQHDAPARPDWAAEAARRSHNGGKNQKNQNVAQKSRGERQRGGWGDDDQDFATATFNTSERIASGRAGRIKATKNSNKDVHHLSKPGEYMRNDYR